MEKSKPVIVTLKIDEVSQAWFNRLRLEHFPVAINYLDAHCTMFHHLGNDALLIADRIRGLSLPASFPAMVTGIRHLGNGVAFKLSAPPLLDLHTSLKHEFDELLIPQDRQKYQPHITIQNKVSAEKSKLLFDQLNLSFEPFELSAIGLGIWLYCGGPWQHAQDLEFAVV